MMADLIGVSRRYFQTSNKGVPHYDIALSKKAKAIKNGAILIDDAKVIEIANTYKK